MNNKKYLIFFVLLLIVFTVGVYLFYNSYLNTLKITYGINKNILTNYNDKINRLQIYSDEDVKIYDEVFYYKIKSEKLPNAVVNAITYLVYSKKKYDFKTEKLLEFLKVDDYFFQNELLNKYISPFLDDKVKSKFPDYIFAKIFLLQDAKEKFGFSKIYLDFLNNYSFTSKSFGLEGAANYFFGKNFDELNLREQLYLIILPFKRKYKDINRTINGLLWQLLNNKIIGKEEFDKNILKKLCFNVRKPFIKYKYLADAALNELESRNIKYKEKNLTVKLSVNLKLSNEIDCLIQDEVRKINPLLRSAFVLIDKNKILAVAGRKNAALYRRQIGSIFKPIVYLTAFENGIKPNDFIVDKPYIFKKHGKVYKPKNYEDFFMGKTYVRNGMIYSLNNATVKLAEKTGFEKIAKKAVEMGLKTVKPYLAMPLGVIPFTPLEVSKAYNVLLNNGVKKDISLIKSIYDNELKSELTFKTKDKRIFSEKTTKTVKNIMKEVVKRGTARGAGLLKGTAGKTGTTNDYKDAWFLGIYKDYLGVCWVGFNSMKSMGDNASGGHTAAPIFSKIQKKFMK